MAKPINDLQRQANEIVNNILKEGFVVTDRTMDAYRKLFRKAENGEPVSSWANPLREMTEAAIQYFQSVEDSLARFRKRIESAGKDESGDSDDPSK